MRCEQDREAFWEDLFAGAGEGAGVSIQMRAACKHGRPFLLVPCKSRAAAACLNLYPAQTPRARLVRSALRWLLRAGLPLGTRRISLRIPDGDPFAGFLASLQDGRGLPVPTLGVLAGNPATPGQRFLLLVFDRDQSPAAVVKAGVTDAAKSLIEKEEAFLAAVPQDARSIPKLRAVFRSPRVRALALDYFAGHSPGPQDEAAVPPLLASWVDSMRTLELSATANWARLEKAAAAEAVFASIARRLRGRTIHPAIQHGDFAPWNIKVSRAGDWMVLDWERGELAGIPAWDWFHYVIQPAILVEHVATAGLIQRIEALLSSEAFTAYTVRAGIVGCERDLFLAYLLHVVHVLKPSEGLSATDTLLRSVSGRWRQD